MIKNSMFEKKKQFKKREDQINTYSSFTEHKLIKYLKVFLGLELLKYGKDRKVKL